MNHLNQELSDIQCISQSTDIDVVEDEDIPSFINKSNEITGQNFQGLRALVSKLVYAGSIDERQRHFSWKKSCHSGHSCR